jgi:hypothetical protein
MKKFIIGLIVLLVCLLIYMVHQNRTLTAKYETSIENIKAYDSQLSGLNNSNKVFKLTIDQLNYFKDSILIKMNEVRKELNIKDSKIKQMQYQLSHVEKPDSIILKDTVFVESFKLDTIIGDEWANTHLIMKYPNCIKFTPKFKLESFLFVESKKETVNPPKKFFLFRWFQRKHTVLNVTVKENNPYVETDEQKFVEIIK